MGDALARWGIETMPGFDPAHLEPAPDLVVVGNVCRKDNPEARAAIDGGLRVHARCPARSRSSSSRIAAASSSPARTARRRRRRCSRTCSHAGGLEPGLLIGGIPQELRRELPPRRRGRAVRGRGRRVRHRVLREDAEVLALPAAGRDPHVDRARSHRHLPDDASRTVAAFAGFVERIPEDGLLVACAGDPHVREVVRARARAASRSTRSRATTPATSRRRGSPRRAPRRRR